MYSQMRDALDLDLTQFFVRDNFAARRNSGESAGVAYDPESLITGEEESRGLTYLDKRQWPDEATYRNAVAGRIPVDEIPVIAPRVKSPNYRAQVLAALDTAIADSTPPQAADDSDELFEAGPRY